MLQLRVCILLLNMVTTLRPQKYEPIVGGNPTCIEKYPHSVFLNIEEQGEKEFYNANSCGASTVNQVLLLTAAHCVEMSSTMCAKRNKCMKITAFLGETQKESKNAVVRYASNWTTHEEYDTYALINDIALIKLRKPIPLGATMSRVAIMRHPPYHEQAWVAGWGQEYFYGGIHVETRGFLNELAIEPVQRSKCKQMMELLQLNLHDGQICATAANNKTHHSPYFGDSGSPLVVRQYIQIGLVSTGGKSGGTRYSIYTDVGYYYLWIKATAEKLYCLR